MNEFHELGKIGEDLAIQHLLNKGYTILTKNYVFQKAEVDVIAENETQLVVVEVKTRSYNTILEPFEAVNYKKQKLMMKAIDNYVQENNISKEVRFDIISIIKSSISTDIEHIEDAFGII